MTHSSDETAKRKDAVQMIRRALQRRSHKLWSVRTGRGTAWGCIHISAPPSRRVDGVMSTDDRVELSKLLGFKVVVDPDGVVVGANPKAWGEYIDRANGIIK